MHLGRLDRRDFLGSVVLFSPTKNNVIGNTPSTIMFQPLFLILLLTPFALAIPQNGPSYAIAKPLDEMELDIYSGNASKPCEGFLALEYSSPIPVNETNCIAGISSALPLHNLTCVTRKKEDTRMDKCEMWGYLDNKCSGVPVLAGRQAPNASWIWGLGTGQTVDVKSFKVSC